MFVKRERELDFFNRLIVVGNATRDACLLKDKGNLLTFGLGVGGYKDRRTFFNVLSNDPNNAAIAKYIHKGKEVLVEGVWLEVDSNGRLSLMADKIQLGVHRKSARITTLGLSHKEIPAYGP